MKAQPHRLVTEAADEIGSRVTKGEEQRAAQAEAWKPDLIYANPLKIDERWSNACARIGRICEGGGQGARTMEQACKSAAMPVLAHEFLELQFYLLTRARPHRGTGTDHNPFRHLPDDEALAKYRYLVERICDKSTGKFGHWSTK